MGKKNDRPIQWKPQAKFDDITDCWVFEEYRAPEDRSRHSLRMRPLEPWELDDRGAPLPDLNPNSDSLEEQQNATPRASSSNLATALESLSIHEPEMDRNNYRDLSLDKQTSPNYSHLPQEQGNPYGLDQEGYNGPPETMPQSSRKGKEREYEDEAPPSSSRNEGSRSSRHGSHHHRRSSHKKPSSSKGSTANSKSHHHSQSSGSGGAPTFYGLAGGSQNSSHRTRSSQSASPYPLATVTETPTTFLDTGVDESLVEGGGYDQLGNHTGWPSAESSASSYVTTVSAYPPAQATGRRFSNIPDQIPRTDPRYRWYHADEYRPGRIFKLMWSQPMGVPTGLNNSELTDRERVGPSEISQNSQPWQGYRRFIIVSTTKGHVTGIPIYTYQGQGCCKRGVKAEQHGIIHEEHVSPQPLHREPRLGFDPVRARMHEFNEQLQYTSRVNYSKWATLEMNNPVLWVGTIVQEDWDRVLSAFNRCLENGNKTWGASGAWGRGGGKRR